ncbi:SRPBCC family protein [Pseudovibrio sp. Tun.PSC04-5.I4]|uniref:SRPBCC family protein n=1 Tax=Pseudovibrio sp. Tun.PSC04-5.I4 TaxID=1798213 RepID=UPI00088F7060|nr:SRPBCC family protein [Pseudovibrio sp. Tun.PSC04-5.I4]SDR28111.1 Polyketide cyclase / dehydrase and lipid transport [Pseudovibrio sp. Tun.PSC04-5.I4]
MALELRDLPRVGSVGFLRVALLGNALFSAGCGILMLAMPSTVSEAIGWQGPHLWFFIGAGLLVFAGALVWQGVQSNPPKAWSLLFSIGDYLWVVGTALSAMFACSLMDSGGWIFTWGVASTVALFGTLQLMGIVRLYRQTAVDYALVISVDVKSNVEQFWPVLSDLGGIKKHTQNLASSELVGGRDPSLGVRRECASLDGARWAETVTAWVPRDGFDVIFNADEPDFPFPFQKMLGGWRLVTRQNQTTVSVYWIVEPKVQLSIVFLMPVMELRMRKDMASTIKSMDRAALKKKKQMDEVA